MSGSLSVCQELFDFIATELQHQGGKSYPTIRKLTKTLKNQRDQLLAFAGIQGQKLEDIAQRFESPLSAVRDVCLLHRKRQTSNAYWERRNQLYAQLPGKFYIVMAVIDEALHQTPRASSMVENLESRIRNYFGLRRSLGNSYLGLFQYFLNYRFFMRSQVPERVGKSPKQLLTGQTHPHWLELPGFERFPKSIENGSPSSLDNHWRWSTLCCKCDPELSLLEPSRYFLLMCPG